MKTETTKTLASYEGYKLVEHCPCGEKRIEHAESGTYSLWLTFDEVADIMARPHAMPEWAADDGSLRGDKPVLHRYADATVIRDATADELHEGPPASQSRRPGSWQSERRPSHQAWRPGTTERATEMPWPARSTESRRAIPINSRPSISRPTNCGIPRQLEFAPTTGSRRPGSPWATATSTLR